jgi:hypothetical protein
MKFTRRSFLTSSALCSAGLTLPLLARAGGSGNPTRLIVVFASGGWDVTYCFDPKYGSSTIDGPDSGGDSNEEVRTIGGIPLAVNDVRRPALSAFFSQWADHCAVVNGIWVGSIAHPECSVRMLTGKRTSNNPDLAAVSGYVLGGPLEDVPLPYMDLSSRGYTGNLAAFSGRTGTRNQIKALLDRSLSLPTSAGNPITYPQFVPQTDDASAIAAFLRTRRDRFAATRGAHGRNASLLADYLESLERADRLVTDGQDFASELSFGVQASFSNQVSLAVDLLDIPLTHSVIIDTGLDWDTHDDNDSQNNSYESMFTGLSELMELLQLRGMLNDTVVAVVSEMTRTPKLNDDSPEAGKDHWPVTSALLIGAPATGLRGGQSFGASDDNLDAAAIDLSTGAASTSGSVMRYENFAAGLLALLDIDPEPWFPGQEVFRAFIA